MPTLTVNIACELTLSGLDHHQVHGVSYRSDISELFTLNVDLITSQPPAFFDTAAYSGICLKISGDTAPCYFNGIIQDTKIIKTLKDGTFHYQLTIEPTLALLNREHKSHLYNDLTLVELCQEVLLNIQEGQTPVLADPEALSLALSQMESTYPQKANWIQHDETTYQFLKRALSQHGFSFYFDHHRASCPLVISDRLYQVASITQAPFHPADQEHLSLAPSVTRIALTGQMLGPDRVRVTGYNPDYPEQTINSVTMVDSHYPSKREALWRFDALSPKEAEQWSQWAAQSYYAQRNALPAGGRGILFAGDRIALTNHPFSKNYLITSITVTLEFDRHRFNQLRNTHNNMALLDNDIIYRDLPVFRTQSGILVGAHILSQAGDASGDDHALDGKGAYKIAPPESWYLTGRGEMAQLRILNPVQSRDHQVNMPLPVSSEVSLGFHSDDLDRPFIEGANTHSNMPALTRTSNAQNHYWQDKKLNRIGYINEGDFDRNQSTGRKSATITEVPNYNDIGQSSYMRQGDPVNEDQTYPSVYGSKGHFIYTEGDFHSQHDGGLANLIGNRDATDPNQSATPAYRHMVQADMKDNGLHVLETSHVDTHQHQILVQDAEITTTQNSATINTTHTAKNTLDTVNADTTGYIYVNQLDTYQSDTVGYVYNAYTMNVQTPLSETTQVGKTREDTHTDTRTTRLLHTTNLHNATTMSQQINQGQYTINNHNVQSGTLSENIGTLTQQHNTSITTVGNMQDGADHYTHTGNISINTGASANPASVPAPMAPTPGAINPLSTVNASLEITLVDQFTQDTPEQHSFMAELLNQFTLNVSSTSQTLSKLPFAQQKLQFPLVNNSESITITLIGKDVLNGQSVSIIAMNQQSLGYPTDTLVITPSQLTLSKDSEGKPQYQIQLTLLPPAMLLNFRHDCWQSSLGADQPVYETLKSYFDDESKPPVDANGKTLPFDKTEFNDEWKPGNQVLQPWMIEYFKANGNNATLFIHGYNVKFGQFAQGLAVTQKTITPLSFNYGMPSAPITVNTLTPSADLPCSAIYRDDRIMKSQYGSAYDPATLTPDKETALNGNEAHKWLVHMEQNLNLAAGFDGKDYSNFNRLLACAWQGNPTQAYDYMAATAMTHFPATKIVAIIQQLKSAGLTVNVVCHSLGNGVLMNVLNQCGAQGTAIDHVFMWDAAIPDDCFNTTPRQYFPIVINGQTINYEYNYLTAQQGAKAFTVLYSNNDNILGSIQTNKPQNKPVEWTVQVMHDFFYGVLSPGKDLMASFGIAAYDAISLLPGVSLTEDWLKLPNGATITYCWLKGIMDGPSDDDLLDVLKGKMADPAAGTIFAAIAETAFIIDNYALPAIQTQAKMYSIYHLANLLTYPLSYFLKGDTASICTTYYQQWRTEYQAYTDIQTKSSNQLPATLIQQQERLRTTAPDAFNLLSVGFHLAKTFAQIQYTGLKGYNAALDYFKSSEPCLKWYESNDINFRDPDANALATIVLTALLTPKASPATAMGYGGVDIKTPFANDPKYHGVNQVDPVTGKQLLPDHNGMEIPNSELFQKIYVDQLMGRSTWSFKSFGNYDLSKVNTDD